MGRRKVKLNGVFTKVRPVLLVPPTMALKGSTTRKRPVPAAVSITPAGRYTSTSARIVSVFSSYESALQVFGKLEQTTANPSTSATALGKVFILPFVTKILPNVNFKLEG